VAPTFTLEELEPQTTVYRPDSGPFFGQTLWIFGAFLWGYVVIGEFVTNLGLPELSGVVALLGVLALAVLRALETARANRARWLRQVGPVAAGILLFTLIVLLALSLATSVAVKPGALSVALWFVAAFALFAGRYWTRRDRPRRKLGVWDYFAWAMSGVATLVALLSVS
jgi:uncharacterized membrane protein SirB2